MKTTKEICDDAEYYASKIRENLMEDPEGIDPIITSNAHKLGYMRGAFDVNLDLMRAEDRIRDLRSKVKILHWQLAILIFLAVVLELIIILK